MNNLLACIRLYPRRLHPKQQGGGRLGAAAGGGRRHSRRRRPKRGRPKHAESCKCEPKANLKQQSQARYCRRPTSGAAMNSPPPPGRPSFIIGVRRGLDVQRAAWQPGSSAGQSEAQSESETKFKLAAGIQFRFRGVGLCGQLNLVNGTQTRTVGQAS